MSTTPSLPTVVLVHGAWVDGSSWQRVILLLQDKGVPVVAVQNPTSSLDDDVLATQHVLNNVDGPVVLVGHSWGGSVITEAGNNPKVRALVYVAAFAPKAGESGADQVGRYPVTPGLTQISPDTTGYLLLTENGWVEDVGQDLPISETRMLAVLQPPLPPTTFGGKITRPAWEYRLSWYVVSTEDRIFNIDLQREIAGSIKAKTIEIEASHLSPLSQPEAVTEVILEAVNSIASNANLISEAS